MSTVPFTSKNSSLRVKTKTKKNAPVKCPKPVPQLDMNRLVSFVDEIESALKANECNYPTPDEAYVIAKAAETAPDALQYRGCYAKIAYDPFTLLFTGHMLGSLSFIQFSGYTLHELEENFHKLVDGFHSVSARVLNIPEPPAE